MNEKVIEQLAEAFKHDFDLIQDDLGAIEQFRMIWERLSRQ